MERVRRQDIKGCLCPADASERATSHGNVAEGRYAALRHLERTDAEPTEAR